MKDGDDQLEYEHGLVDAFASSHLDHQFLCAGALDEKVAHLKRGMLF